MLRRLIEFEFTQVLRIFLFSAQTHGDSPLWHVLDEVTSFDIFR